MWALRYRTGGKSACVKDQVQRTSSRIKLGTEEV
jgi:hypothetical protein